MRAVDRFVEVWCAFDESHTKQNVEALVRAESALGLPFGLPHHKVHDVLIAWKRAGCTYGEAFHAFRAGARTLMP